MAAQLVPQLKKELLIDVDSLVVSEVEFVSKSHLKHYKTRFNVNLCTTTTMLYRYI